MAGENGEKNTPPYASYKTVTNFLEGLKFGIPSHIDRSVVPTLSGSSQAQLISALRSLGLIDEDGSVTELLRQLVDATGQEKQDIWKKILRGSYPYLFDDFDLATAPPSQFENRFKEYGGVSGGTVRRCMIFFISAASEAGIPLSNFIKKFAQRRPSGTNSSKPKIKKSIPNSDGEEFVDGDDLESDQNPAVAVEPKKPELRQPSVKEKMLDKMTDKFPSYDPNWGPDVQAKWFEAFTSFNQQIMEMANDAE